MKKTNANDRFSAAKVIFDTIVENLENNTIIWEKPWINAEMPCNAVSKRAYRGFNAFLLNFVALSHGYKTNRFVTYKQAQEMGGNVRRGEKGTMIVFCEKQFAYKKDENGKRVLDDNGKAVYDYKKCFFLSRYYIVFNIDQCDGLPEKLYTTQEFATMEDKSGEDIVNGYTDCPSIVFGGSVASYSPSFDTINMPHMKQFKTKEGYYSTLFHEMTHSTGAAKRLDRPMSGKFGTEEYAKEELIAEIGSAILMNETEMKASIEDKAAYCKSWLKAIKEMKENALMSAFTKAWAAAEWVKGNRKTNQTTEEEKKTA